MTVFRVRGFDIYKGFLSPERQQALVQELRDIIRAAPLFSPQTPYGKPMSVQMTSMGDVGWFADRTGYRYVDRHPNGKPWPAIPAEVQRIWGHVSGLVRPPECCLLNYYTEAAKMGMHQDRDEADFSWPVVSISLGDAALFRIGNTTRGGKTESMWLESGDVLVMGGEARMTYHGVDRIRFGSSALLRRGGRINLTLRIVT